MKYRKLILFIPVILAVVLAVLFLPGRIVVNEIECRSQFGPCNDILKSKTESVKGKNLETARNEVIKFLKESPLDKNFSFRFMLPGKLIVEIVERKSKYALLLTSKAYFLIDEDFIYLTKQDSALLPKLDTTAIDLQIKPGDKADAKIMKALQLLDYMNYAYGIGNGVIYSQQVEFKNVGFRYKIIFPIDSEKSAAELIGGMVVIIRQLNENENNSRIIKSKSFTEIDFRFKNPILR